MDAIPNNATSEEVSKPRPNKTPKGYLVGDTYRLALHDTRRCLKQAFRVGVHIFHGLGPIVSRTSHLKRHARFTDQ